MRHFSFISSLLTIGSLACLVGCYSTIPATTVNPIFSPCGIARETHKANEYENKSRLNQEQVMVDGMPFRVYFTDSVGYSYDIEYRITRKHIGYYQGDHSEEIFTYSPGSMVSTSTWKNSLGAVTSQSSYSIGLNGQGYDARYSYNEEGQRVKPDDKGGFKYEVWEKGNLIQGKMPWDGVVMIYSFYSYDLTHFSLPNPRQFNGLGSKNLVTSEVYYPTVSGDTVRTNYTYQFEVRGRVKRKIQASTFYRPGFKWTNKSAPDAIYVTDYEYRCP